MKSRQTTLESLIGVVGLLNADDREVFAIYYQLATHDSSGLDLWEKLQKRESRKLNSDEIKWIREHYIRYDAKYGIMPLSKQFGVCRETINYIIKKKEQRG